MIEELVFLNINHLELKVVINDRVAEIKNTFIERMDDHVLIDSKLVNIFVLYKKVVLDIVYDFEKGIGIIYIVYHNREIFIVM